MKCIYNEATKPKTFSSMVKDMVTEAGRIDVLVNNFGISIPCRALDYLHRSCISRCLKKPWELLAITGVWSKNMLSQVDSKCITMV